jgi:FixJ family two-component response regulator/anti-sigma regulatory factor (Ser/Thr protein kinase)
VAQRVLVVEDDPPSRRFLAAALARSGFLVAMAEGVEEAQRQLASSGDFSCVVTDYRMPERNGLELLSWITAHDPGLATILITAEGEKGLVTESLRGGAVDFLEKPVDAKKLCAAVARAATLTQSRRHMAESEVAVQRLGRAQRRMVAGETLPDGGSVEICFYPKHETGGDFFSRFQPGPGRFYYLLTDVSGHDLQAAYASAYFQGVMRGMLARGAAVDEILPDFNRFLLEEWNQVETMQGDSDGIGASVAACVLSVDWDEKIATVHTRGAPAPIFVQPNGAAQEVGMGGGAPLGWFEDASGPGENQCIRDGGSFYLWTDGLEDLAEREGVSPLSLAFALQRAKSSPRAHALLAGATDDILVAFIHLASASRDEVFCPLLLEHYHGGRSAEIDALQTSWQRSLRLALPELSEADAHDILLATREGLLNALVHGCARHADQAATLQIAVGQRSQTVRVRISDPGPGHDFDVAAQARQALQEPLEQHQGLLLMHRLAAHLTVERRGATVIMNFHPLHPNCAYELDH